MSASAVSLPTAVVSVGPRSGYVQNSGGDAVEGRNSFEHLISGGKAAAVKSEVRSQRAEHVGKDSKVDAADQSADPAKDKTAVDGNDAARVAGDEHKTRDEDDKSESSKDSAKPADGSTLLAWLQASTTRTPAGAAGAAGAAAAKLGDGIDLTRLAGGTALAVTPDAAKLAADGVAAQAATIGGDTDTGIKPFHLPLLGAADGREPDKAVIAGVDVLITKDLAAAPQPTTTNASALAATAFVATTATAGQDRGSALSVSALPLALQSPLDAESQQLPQQIGERVQWLVSAGVQEARLQLHPRDLGSITVRVRLEAGSASVFFGAEHPAARAALEASLPQLREQFASSGMQLAQTQVSSQQSGGWSFGGSQTSGERGSAGGNSAGRSYAGGEGSDAPLGTVATRIVRIGLLDDYA